MTKADAAQFEAGMIALAAVTGKELDQFEKRAYWAALEDIPGDVVLAALKLAMNSCDYFPTAAEIRRFCDEAEAERLGQFSLTAPVDAPQLGPGEVVDVYQGALPEDPQPLYGCHHCRDTTFTHHVCEPGNRCSIRGCQNNVHSQGDENVPSHTYVKKCACITNADGTTRTLEQGGNKVILARRARAMKSHENGKYYKTPRRAGRSSYREDR